LFDPVAVALSGRHHGIVSDARSRFERGIDPALLPAATDMAAAMVMALCGGVASEVAEAGAEPGWQRTATLRFARLAGFGGLDVAPDEAVGRLERLGFVVAARDDLSVTVRVPSWRNDVAAASALEADPAMDPAKAAKAAAGRAEMEPEADLVEEVLRLGGLDAVPAVSMPYTAPVPTPTLTARQTRNALARRVIAASGYAECVTFSFMPAKEAALFGPAPEGLRLLNPIAADLDQLRATPLATLAMAAARNAARGYADVNLFEIGPAFRAEGQTVFAAGIRAGMTPRAWNAAAEGGDAMAAKADVWAVLAALGVPMEALTTTADAPGHYHPGRSGVVRQGPKTVLATFGALHPSVLAALDLTGPAVAFEIDLNAIQEPKRKKKGLPDLPAFQAVKRDFAFVVDSAVAAEVLLKAARGAERALIAGVALFDVYEGEKMEPGKKSLAIEVTFQPRERTLTDAEIEAACAKVVAAVAKATGAILRG
jgi:phenylalanyl-tRNA synthetase beta chain